MSNPTFAECFCAKNNIPPEEFAHSVFNRVVYPRTHLVKWLLPLLNPNYFAADYDLIYAVESLTSRRDFDLEVARFSEHPGNHGWLRRTLCLRVSTGRLKKLLRETMTRSTRSQVAGADVNDDTVVPFDFKGPRQSVVENTEEMRAGAHR